LAAITARKKKNKSKDEDSNVIIEPRSDDDQDHSGANKGVIWLFSGYGSAWLDMRKELLAREKLFYDTVATLDENIVEELGFSARSALETGK
jgi:acyl transferase domain-containing protein